MSVMILRPNGFGSVRVSLIARTRVVKDEPTSTFKVMVVLKDRSEFLWTRELTEGMARTAVENLTFEVNHAD